MVPEHRRHRWTAEDLSRMVEAGLLQENDPLELIDGELIVMSPQGPRHRMSTVRVRRCLEQAFGPGFYVQDHSPVLAAADSVPEPDVAVVRLPEQFDRHPSAADVVLVVEISHSSQDEDRAKASVYAGGGFETYWNLDLVARRLMVYTDPHPGDREYRRIAVVGETERVTGGSGSVAVRDLLPPS